VDFRPYFAHDRVRIPDGNFGHFSDLRQEVVPLKRGV